ncbi:hypothetical protein SteCoe_14919 [Stentor coeruleus]|uniref:Uncharacterized protein n=1 Tax=Stentor coeruleus TaxID=5963 RepID=A0A1R2C4Z7_9CILI|nr:hypothetical protein SteCoe_14919 [Stentor coeruleus]
MKKTRISVPSFWISPQENLLESPMIKLISKLNHRRCNSGKISPYKDQSSLTRLQSVLRASTRQQSPKPHKPHKSSPSKSISCKKLINKPVAKKKIKRKKKHMILPKLKDLQGSYKYKAPKAFKNQIFRDVYDEKGNHDRIMETFEVSESLPEILTEENLRSASQLIIPKDIELQLKEYDTTERRMNLKQPDNSFLQKTEDNMKINRGDLFKKLQKLAFEREEI